MKNDKKKRCQWGDFSKLSKKMKNYHDERWCKEVHDDQELFAMLILEGFQAGLSWNTIIEKEDNFRKAFDEFDPEIVADYGKDKIDKLMSNKGIIRNKRKIEATINNAKAFLKIQKEFGSFDKYIWGFTYGKVIDHHLKRMKDMPAKSELSEKVSKDLKKRKFRFVGTVYKT